MARRTRGRGHIEERPNGTFRAVVYAGKDPHTGRDRYLKKSAADEKRAQVALSALLNQVDEQRHPRSGITVRHMIERWFEVADHARSTRHAYVQLVTNYIDPAFGNMQVSKLDPELLEGFYARLLRCRALCSGKKRAGHECRPLSNSSIRAIHFIIRAASDRAVRWRYLNVNPAALAEPPEFKRPAPDPPSAEEIAAVLNEAWTEPPWGLLLWLVMVTGCRRGELCALRWTDLNLDRGVVTIERSADQTSNGVQEKSTKTGQKRRLALDTYTVDLLRAYRELCEEQCRSLGITLERSAFVFSTSPDFATPRRPDSITQRYRRLAQRNQLRSTRLHALRHYSATELLTAGIDVRTVAGRLGHGSGGATTLRFYAAWVNEADKKAATAIADVIPRPNPLLRTPRSPYELLASELRTAIERGDYPPGALLPTTTQLAAAHSVAAGTVNRAIGLLKDAELVTAGRGLRVTVCGPRAGADA